MNKKGFSLIELLVVVAIIGILSVILVPNVQEQLRRAKIAKTKAFISSLETYIVSYKNDFGKYPDSYDPQQLYYALVEKAKNVYEPNSDEVRMVERGDSIWVRDDAPALTANLIEEVLQRAGVPADNLKVQEESPVFIDAWGNPIYFISHDIYNPGGKTDFRKTNNNSNLSLNKPCAYEMRDSKRYRPYNPTSFQIISFGPDETTITPSNSNGGIGSMLSTDKVDNDGDEYLDNEDRIRSGNRASDDPEVLAEDDITNFM